MRHENFPIHRPAHPEIENRFVPFGGFAAP
jgi:hypothetical protein